MNVDIIALVVAIGAFILSVTQTIWGYRREKMESTLRAYYDLLESSIYPLQCMIRQYESQPFQKGSEEWDRATSYLMKIENFSVGINTGIYSLRTLNRLGGGFMRKLYKDVLPIIQIKRLNNTRKHYDEFELMINQLYKLCSKRKRA